MNTPITDQYVQTYRQQVHDWCIKKNPTLNDYQNYIITFCKGIHLDTATHVMALLQEHEDWPHYQPQLSPHNGCGTIEELVKCHIQTHVYNTLRHNLFCNGLPALAE